MKVFCSECKKEIKPGSKYKMTTRSWASAFSWGCYVYHPKCLEKRHKRRYSFLEVFKSPGPKSDRPFKERTFILQIAYFIILAIFVDMIFFACWSYNIFSVFISINIMFITLIIIEIIPILKARRIKKFLG